MRRSSALLATAALAASVLLVPNAALADAKGVLLTLDFDRLAKERVAKFKVTAASASGVTSVRAYVRHRSSTAEPYATVDLERTDGTDNDGVWQADFRTDIAARPGINFVEAVVTTADGETVKRTYAFNDCYTTSIAGFGNSPGVIDIDHSKVTMDGRVLVQKDRETAPEPAAGATVRTRTGVETTTGDDGAFTVASTGDHHPEVEVPAQGNLCSTYQAAAVTVEKQRTEITARLDPGQTVAPYTDMTVEGKVVRYGSAGPVPLGDVEVRVEVPNELIDIGQTWVRTRADGTFRAYFNAAREAGRSGAVVARVGESGFLLGSQAGLGTLNIRNISEITGFDAFPAPLAYGDPISVHGTLTIRPNFTNVANLPLYLEFSPDGKTWTIDRSQTLDDPGNFYFNEDKPVKKDGYWRVRYPGSGISTPVVGPAKYVDVKYRTQWYNFNASPEPVKKGKTITVKGQLYRFQDVAGPGPNAPVYVYFKRAGSSSWTQMAATKTDGKGWFQKTFKASADGYWMASYKGSSAYFPSDTPGDYVDVR